MNKKLQGSKNQRQGTEAEIFVMQKLRKNGWTVIPTKGSKSPLDIIAHHQRKGLWWGVQVKSTINKMTFDIEELSDICRDLYLMPVLAYVKSKKPRELYFCLKQRGRFFHVLEGGGTYHPLGGEWDCVAFKSKLSIG